VSYFQTNDLIKIRLPSRLTKNYWAIEEKSKKATFAVPTLAVLMALACAKPKTKKDLFDFFQDRKMYDTDKIEHVLNQLISKNIIHSFSSLESQTNPAFDKWKKAGWEAAAHYHFFAWDAPFLDYTKEGGGHDRDRKNMLQYQSEQPDNQRFKLYSEFLGRQDLPNSFQSPITLEEKVRMLLSLAFGKRGEKPCHWSEIPLLRRTSPSGGSRHPTEGYFLSRMNEIPSGWYHIQTEPPSLVHFSTQSQPTFLESFDQQVFGFVILTTIFERNMYRYREPRTFRTVHMDVGHIIETIEQLGKELGIKTQVHLNFDEADILEKIGASKFEEGVMGVVSFKEDMQTCH
jgi:SagB-type dehydrogenase family enzyme